MSFGTANRVRELRWMRGWILIRSCDVGGKLSPTTRAPCAVLDAAGEQEDFRPFFAYVLALRLELVRAGAEAGRHGIAIRNPLRIGADRKSRRTAGGRQITS